MSGGNSQASGEAYPLPLRARKGREEESCVGSGCGCELQAAKDSLAPALVCFTTLALPLEGSHPEVGARPAINDILIKLNFSFVGAAGGAIF